MTDALRLQGWTATEVHEADDITLIEAVCDATPSTCPKCGCIDTPLGHGSKLKTVIDLPDKARPTIIEVKAKRYRCRHCKATFLQPLPGLRHGMFMTGRCAARIEELGLIETFTGIARQFGCDEKTVRTLVHAYIERINSVYRPWLPEHLGIDETQIDGVMRCIFTDVTNRVVIDMIPDRSQEAVRAWLMQFKDRSVVKAVATDMWRPYRQAVNELLPGVPVVLDKFHILRTANYCMERVRIKLQKIKKTRERKRWLQSKHVLNKRESTLNDKQRLNLDIWLANEPLLAQAHSLKEDFYAIFDMPKDEGIQAFDAFASRIPRELKEDFKVLTTSMKNWRGDILVYFDNPITNAYTEAINGVAKVINRRGRGYTYPMLRAKLIFKKECMVTCEYCKTLIYANPISPFAHITPKIVIKPSKKSKARGRNNLICTCNHCNQFHRKESVADDITSTHQSE